MKSGPNSGETLINQAELQNFIAIHTLKTNYPGMFVDRTTDKGATYTTLDETHPLFKENRPGLVLTQSRLACWDIKGPTGPDDLNQTMELIASSAKTLRHDVKWIGPNFIHAFPDISSQLNENVIFTVTLPRLVGNKL